MLSLNNSHYSAKALLMATLLLLLSASFVAEDAQAQEKPFDETYTFWEVWLMSGPTPSPYATWTPEPTQSPKPSPYATWTPEPTASPTPSPYATWTPIPTSSPSPSPYPSQSPPPSPTPEPYQCCIYKIQEPSDTSCEYLDQAQCEAAFEGGTEGSPDTLICTWNLDSGVCENLFDNMCEFLETNDDCDYSETHYVTSDYIDIPITLPEECYQTNARISEEYCGHGTGEMCEDYFDQIDDLLPPEPGSSYCLSVSSPACSLFEDEQETLAQAQDICSTLNAQFGGTTDFEITISGNQCIALMTMEGLPMPEGATTLNICISNDGVEVEYPECQSVCSDIQGGESIECIADSEEEPITVTCCPSFGVAPVPGGDFVEIYLGHEWIEGEFCEEREPEEEEEESTMEDCPGAGVYQRCGPADANTQWECNDTESEGTKTLTCCDVSGGFGTSYQYLEVETCPADDFESEDNSYSDAETHRLEIFYELTIIEHILY